LSNSVTKLRANLSVPALNTIPTGLLTTIKAGNIFGKALFPKLPPPTKITGRSSSIPSFFLASTLLYFLNISSRVHQPVAKTFSLATPYFGANSTPTLSYTICLSAPVT